MINKTLEMQISESIKNLIIKGLSKGTIEELRKYNEELDNFIIQNEIVEDVSNLLVQYCRNETLIFNDTNKEKLVNLIYYKIKACNKLIGGCI